MAKDLRFSASTLLDSATKEVLRKTIRGLREKLVAELSQAAKSEYHLDVSLDKAQLPEARRCRRERLEAWLDEQIRGATAEPQARGAAAKKGKADKAASAGKGKASKAGKRGGARQSADELRARFLGQAVTEAAHTLVNRLVFLRVLEHHGVLRPALITGGSKSAAYEQEFVHYAGPLASSTLSGDDTRGYRELLEVVFAEYALELPGLFGPVGLTPLFPIPARTLADVIEALNDPALDAAWGDDTTLGWVYQYWNDPERERLDAKIADGGKVEPHEIASKTQMFTERYMVEWLLQNSLGLTWLCICKKKGWTPDADAVLPALEERRAAWRAKREAGEVPPDALMPIASGLEDAWKYYVVQPLPADAVAQAPSSLRELRLLDPACGSGHFLVIAFDLLVNLYQEEARHRGASWSDAEIAQWILADNLHGIDIDPRAIQIAAAGLWLKAKLTAADARLPRLNLVAPVLRLGNLPEDDPALTHLVTELERQVRVPRELTLRLVQGLAGVDFLGSLLRVDQAVGEALEAAAQEYDEAQGWQGDLYSGFRDEPSTLDRAEAKASVLTQLEAFLARHSASEDLGIRLDGEQLTAGVRFVRMVQEGTYDIVVGNPPYQGLSKTTELDYVVKNYPRGKADLYAAFLERGLELVREGGLNAMVTMRGWMFLGQFSELRRGILHDSDLRGVADLGTGAFSSRSMDDVISTALAVLRRGSCDKEAYGVKAAPLADPRRDAGKPTRRRAALCCQEQVFQFDPKGFEVIEGEPIVYWWTKEFLADYGVRKKLRDVASVRQGLCTGDNTRSLRKPWEIHRQRLWAVHCGIPGSEESTRNDSWTPFIKGGEGRAWIEPLEEVVDWRLAGLKMRLAVNDQGRPAARPQNVEWYFKGGVAFTTIGAAFSARRHRFFSVFGDMGRTVFHEDPSSIVALMNTQAAKDILTSLAPGIHFSVGDVLRLPFRTVEGAATVAKVLDDAFDYHERAREASIEFRQPGPSPWRYAQDWAQRAVDRPEGAPLPPYEPEYDPPAPEAHVSFAIGVALGRFGANGEGILDAADAVAQPEGILPGGILFVGPEEHLPDSLQHPAVAGVHAAWAEHGGAITGGATKGAKKVALRDWLRRDFFAYHKSLYENRPIYFPLSSEKKTFVAWVSIHRWADNTLQALLAEHLHPVLRQLDGEIADLNAARASSDKKAAAAAEKQYASLRRQRDELADFIEAATQCAERGAPPTDPRCPPREVDAPFRMDLDDGVMINSAALWPLLAPHWADPKKWWKQLCQAEGRKDYDWSHLARRYFPTRVEEKCKTDPSLAVAHGCFWKYHPAKAYAWELRLQDEIAPEFTIDEAESAERRARFLADHADEARAIEEKEQARRERARSKAERAEDATESSDEPAAEELEEVEP